MKRREKKNFQITGYLSFHVFTDKDTDNSRHHQIMVIVLSLIKYNNSSHDYPLATKLKSVLKNVQEKKLQRE